MVSGAHHFSLLLYPSILAGARSMILPILVRSLKYARYRKLPIIWTDEKQKWEESEKRRKEERRSGKRKSQKTDFSEAAGARKGSKVAQHCNTMFFPMICRSGGLKSRLAEATGAEPCGQMNRWSGKIAKCIGTRPPALHSTFHF